MAMHLVIDDDNMVHVKSINEQIISKTITLETLLGTIQASMPQVHTTPDLPINTIKYQSVNNNIHRVAMVVPETIRPYTYQQTRFDETPFPKLLFIFDVDDKCLTGKKVLAVKDPIIRSNTRLYRFPYAHAGFSHDICFGINALPEIPCLTTLPSITELFLSMPSGDDFYAGANKTGLTLREVLQNSQGKPFDYSILVETHDTLENLFS